MARERMSTTSVQMNDKQFEALETIYKELNARSYAEVLRRAFDFYVENKFPELYK